MGTTAIISHDHHHRPDNEPSLLHVTGFVGSSVYRDPLHSLHSCLWAQCPPTLQQLAAFSAFYQTSITFTQDGAIHCREEKDGGPWYVSPWVARWLCACISWFWVAGFGRWRMKAGVDGNDAGLQLAACSVPGATFSALSVGPLGTEPPTCNPTKRVLQTDRCVSSIHPHREHGRPRPCCSCQHLSRVLLCVMILSIDLVARSLLPFLVFISVPIPVSLFFATEHRFPCYLIHFCVGDILTNVLYSHGRPLPPCTVHYHRRFARHDVCIFLPYWPLLILCNPRLVLDLVLTNSYLGWPQFEISALGFMSALWLCKSSVLLYFDCPLNSSVSPQHSTRSLPLAGDKSL